MEKSSLFVLCAVMVLLVCLSFVGCEFKDKQQGGESSTLGTLGDSSFTSTGDVSKEASSETLIPDSPSDASKSTSSVNSQTTSNTSSKKPISSNTSSKPSIFKDDNCDATGSNNGSSQTSSTVTSSQTSSTVTSSTSTSSAVTSSTSTSSTATSSQTSSTVTSSASTSSKPTSSKPTSSEDIETTASGWTHGVYK